MTLKFDVTFYFMSFKHHLRRLCSWRSRSWCLDLLRSSSLLCAKFKVTREGILKSSIHTEVKLLLDRLISSKLKDITPIIKL